MASWYNDIPLYPIISQYIPLYTIIYPYIPLYTMISHFSCLNPVSPTCQAHAEITKLCVGRAQIFRPWPTGRHIGWAFRMLVKPSLEPRLFHGSLNVPIFQITQP